MRELAEEDKARFAELTRIFQKLGADDPEAWAKSEIMENIPQLARFVFLQAAWQHVVSEDDTSWMDDEIKRSSQRPNDPGAGIGPALERLLNSGANRQDITDIVRVKQYEMLFNMCYILDDPGDLEPELGSLDWVLHEVGRDGKPTGRIIQGLYESALEMDPTGREMRPRNNETIRKNS